MTITDELLRNSERYAASFDKGDLPVDADVRQNIARIDAETAIPIKDSVRGFVYDVTTGALREVARG